MPAYNEEATLAQIVELIMRIPHLLELIIVDDFSTDNTPAIAQSLAARDERIRYIRQAKNGGKTEALKAGFAATSGAVVIVQDADLEYDPTEISDVIAPILNGNADVVYGSRFMVKRATRVLYFYHYVANKGLTFLSNCLTNLNMTDVETCYKASTSGTRNLTEDHVITPVTVEVTIRIAISSQMLRSKSPSKKFFI